MIENLTHLQLAIHSTILRNIAERHNIQGDFAQILRECQRRFPAMRTMFSQRNAEQA